MMSIFGGITKNISRILKGGPQVKVTWAGESHVGCVRKRNEDAYQGDEDLGLWVVCDGIGGGTDGDVASKLAVETIVESFKRNGDLKGAILEADKRLQKLPEDQQSMKHRPGCTVVALCLKGEKWQVSWVGDSRVWTFDENQVKQISTDHSVVQQLVNWGDITEEEAKNHPDRHKLSQALGSNPETPVVSTESGVICSEMTFLLATDGLAFWYEPQHLYGVVKESVSEKDVVSTLIQKSLDSGGHDNVTCIVVKATI